MPYRVMITCPTGAWQLTGDTWEQRTHTITWCQETTAEAAEKTAAELRNGAVRGTTVWVEETT